jgi:ADP-ribosylglycohydrolase
VATQFPAALEPGHVVLVSSGGSRSPLVNLECAGPARFRAVPSIAHRLAIAAAGEVAAATSVHSPGAWDYAGGHALLRGAGGAFVDHEGREITYAEDGTSNVKRAFGGHPNVVRELARRDWGRTRDDLEKATEGFPLRSELGRVVRDPGRLSRAQGCLLGQVAGDSLGSLVEFSAAAEIAARHGDGPRRLVDGGRWNTIAGQPTDDSEMALALARTIAANERYSAEDVMDAYKAWMISGPFDIGSTTRAALSGEPTPKSEANGSLMRSSPLGIFAYTASAAEIATLARTDSALTHPNPVCGDSVAAYVVAVAEAIAHGAGPRAAYEAALRWAHEAGAERSVLETLDRAAAEPPACEGPHQGWVRIALQNAFYELLHATSLEEGVVATVRRGGDTDTNAAIAGALLGAVYGRPAVPDQWRLMVQSCHAHGAAAPRSRPAIYWPADALELAERLLWLGGRR